MHMVEQRTQPKLDQAEYASNAGDPLCAQQRTIIETQFPRGSLNYKGLRGWRRRRGEGVMGCRGMDIDVAVGNETAHRIEGGGDRAELQSRKECSQKGMKGTIVS